MAADYEQIDSTQDYAERRGITSRACVVETWCANGGRLRGETGCTERGTRGGSWAEASRSALRAGPKHHILSRAKLAVHPLRELQPYTIRQTSQQELQIDFMTCLS